MTDEILVVVSDAPDTVSVAVATGNPITVQLGDPANPTHGAIGWAFGNGLTALTQSGFVGAGFAPADAFTRRIVLTADVACSVTMDIRRNGVTIFTSVPILTLSGTATDDRTNMTGIQSGMFEGDAFTYHLLSVAGSPHRLTVEQFLTRFT